jgi:hypothetical protein
MEFVVFPVWLGVFQVGAAHAVVGAAQDTVEVSIGMLSQFRAFTEVV